jgi:hypothetical protein
MNNKNAAAAGAPPLYGSSNMPAHLKRHVSNSAFEAAVDEIEAGRYPDMHLVFSPLQPDTSANLPSNAAPLSAAASSAGVRVYVGSQAAAAVPDKPHMQNIEEWKKHKLAALQQSRISVILCCCNDGSDAQWKPFQSSGIRLEPRS